MAAPLHSNAVSRPVSALSTLWAAALMAGIWILLVGGVHRDEMIVGAFCVLAAVIILRLIAGVRRQHVQITGRDLLAGWRIPWYAVQDIFLVSRILLRNVFFGIQPPSAYRVCGFTTSKSDPQDVGRRVLVTGYGSATPNAIVIGVDYAQNRLLFHQLQPSEVNTMTRDLGAKG